MSTVTSEKDRDKVLGELERYYQDKLDAVRVKRGGSGGKPGKPETISDDGVHVRIDPRRKQIVLSWE